MSRRVVLETADCWNLIEPPMTYLKTKALWPLSLYLPQVVTGRAGLALAASVVALIPAILVFLYGQSYLEQGIIAAGTKEMKPMNLKTIFTYKTDRSRPVTIQRRALRLLAGSRIHAGLHAAFPRGRFADRRAGDDRKARARGHPAHGGEGRPARTGAGAPGHGGRRDPRGERCRRRGAAGESGRPAVHPRRGRSRAAGAGKAA